jgi:hypothetical protein
MTTIQLEWDSRDLSMWEGRKLETALTRSLGKAGSDAARAMKAASGKTVRERKRLKVARVNKALPLTFPKVKDISSLVWRMDVSGSPIPAVDYPHRQTRRGVSVEINTGKRSLIRGAFVATMRSGHTGIFRRRGKSRLPIDEVFTSKIADVFRDSGMIPAVHARTRAVFKGAFDRLLPLELAKLKR